MRKWWVLFLLLVILSSTRPTRAFGQNKAGINIGANHQDFEKAADIVGPGGWVVIMACPSDGDKIAEYIAKKPSVNVVIRGHFPGVTPTRAWAKSWAATLGAIPTSVKIYFMPWNEPNQEGSADYGSPGAVAQYIKDLKLEFGALLGRKVVLLSPMMNQSHPNFSSYVSSLRNIDNNFFGQFEGIAISLYDLCPTPLTCDSRYLNPLKVNEVLDEMGASGKPVFGIESGTAGDNFYWKTPPSSSSPLYQFVSGYLAGSPSLVKMFAIPSYDLGGEVGHSWSLFTPEDVVNLLRSAPNGSTAPASSTSFSTSLNRCPGKNYTFYQNSIAECTECGIGFSLLSCKPLSADNFGEEYSRQSLKLTETVFFENTEGCITKEFAANASAANISIPFVRSLNEYFLSPYMDNLNTRVIKQNKDPIKDYGVFEKLASQELQDKLKLEFLRDISGGTTRYQNFNIQGMSANTIASRFEHIKEKQKQNISLSDDDMFFLKNVWTQIPLFANEETEGEIVFEGSGIEGSLKTSVPEVYRLDKVTTLLAKMLGKSPGQTQGLQTERSQVLSAVCETPYVPKIVSTKESVPGPGSDVCSSEEIQSSNENLSGERSYDKSVFEARDMGGCDGKYLNACCSTGGRCRPNPPLTDADFVDELGNSTTCSGGECFCEPCEIPGYSPFSCHYNGFHYLSCKVPANEKTYEVDVNVKNKVPFLERIAENSIGKNGFFSFLVPASLENSATRQIIANVFREVAGESQATIDFKNLRIITPEIKVEPVPQSSPITLLFHKLGSIVNVKNFVAGVELWPSGQWGSETSGTYTPPTADISGFEDLFNIVGNDTGVPPKILAAVMHIEMPSTFNLTAEEVAYYSQQGNRLPGCGPNECSATGPMQMTTGIDNSGSSTCSNCCWQGSCLTSCPNQWSLYGQGDPCNLLDNVYAAARKLKADSGSDSMDWTQEQVYRASLRYYGNCTVSYVRLGNRTYCEYVWWYYTTQ